MLFLLLLGLAGCGREDENLVLLTPGGRMRPAVAAAVAEFEREHPGVKVQVVTTPGQDYYVKSLAMLAGKAHVDVLWMGQGFGIFAGRGALRDLTPFVERDGGFDLALFRPEVVDWYRLGPQLYGIPYGVDVMTIAYNKEIFDAAGVAYPTSDWNLEEMLEIARKVTRIDSRSGRVKVAGLGMESLDYRYHGLKFLSDDQRRFALNTERGREWLERNVELIHRERILQRGADLQSMDRLSGFFNAQTAMIEFATWDLPEAEKRALFAWDVVAIPIGAGGKRSSWASSNGFCMARDTRQPDLAWELLKKVTGIGFQRSVLNATIPTQPTLYPEFLQAHPHPKQVGELLEMQDFMQPNARIALFQEVDSEWIYWKEQALLKKLPVAEALAKAESHINRILDLHYEGKEP